MGVKYDQQTRPNTPEVSPSLLLSLMTRPATPNPLTDHSGDVNNIDPEAPPVSNFLSFFISHI